MSDTAAIIVSGVSKHYPVFSHPWQAVRYLFSLIRNGVPDSAAAASYVEALSDIDLIVEKGERVGIVGRNGAGKSTFLKLLAGGFPPMTGSIDIHGNIYCLLPGSVSFSSEQSAEENARQHLSYLGLSSTEMDARIDDIREFTELGEYFYQPVKNLSLGMRVRTEFAIATAQSADIVIIDEVLGAGDIYWSEKIARRMEQLCASGTTLLLVSHSLSQINRYCDRAIWIERGKIIMDGVALEVTRRYEGFLEKLSWQTDDIDDKSISIKVDAAGMGNEVLPDSGQTVMRWPGRGDVLISGVWLNDRATSHITLRPSDALSIRLRLQAYRPGPHSLRYTLTLWDISGRRVAVMESGEDDFGGEHISVDEYHEVIFSRGVMGLQAGQYWLTVTISDALVSASTTNEHVIRLDALYKSFVIEVGGMNSTECMHPVYRLNFVLE
ncbi:MAG: ABC transporter ATP-binding protein [Castellaniella sp.]